MERGTGRRGLGKDELVINGGWRLRSRREERLEDARDIREKGKRSRSSQGVSWSRRQARGHPVGDESVGGD